MEHTKRYKMIPRTCMYDKEQGSNGCTKEIFSTKDVLRKRLSKFGATADSSVEYSSWSVSKHTYIVQTHTQERNVIEQFHVHLFAVEIQYVRNNNDISSEVEMRFSVGLVTMSKHF